MTINLKEIMPSITNDIAYEYEAIKSDAFEDVIKSFLQNVKANKQPYFKQVMGIPGSGKSTFCKMQDISDAVFISFDAIMESIKEYKEDNQKLGSVKSFAKWEMPARVIGYEVLRRAISQKSNIFFDHSGLFNSCIDLFKNIKKYNYSTQMYCITCDINQAYKRAELREQQTKRHTPKEMITQRAEKLNDFIDQYRKLADKITIYDTTNGDYEIKE